jgi:D-glycero-alpha-D-manno-heptose-7-phosphate kinase
MIESSAPARIDFAGGTLDIWPLYLFFGLPPTLNAAIDCYATVQLTPNPASKAITLESRDLGIREKFSSFKALPEGKHPLSLLIKTVQYYQPKEGATLVTSCQAPPGSGIGGSSALNIALHGALKTWTGRKMTRQTLLQIAKNIETQVIEVPTGWQDYFPALYGGALAVLPGLESVGYSRIPVDLNEMTRRFVLCYTGAPRRSAINNWEVTKDALDGKKSVVRKLTALQNIAKRMEPILRAGKWDALAETLKEEWGARKALAPNIATLEMKNLIKHAKSKGALVAKVCGAGGGGCVAFMVPPDLKTAISNELQAKGGTVLPFRFVKRGLQIKHDRRQ